VKYQFLLSIPLFAVAASADAQVAAPAAAQDIGDDIVVADRIADRAITVLANGAELRKDWSAQPVTVFDVSTIDAVQGADLSRLLERAPGVTLSRNGGLGSVTSLFVRGASSEQTLVLLDGVRQTDVAAPSGGTDLGTQAMGALGKVELLRGSNSVVWGSDALGGVLALTSRQFTGLEASAEGGSHGTFNGDATAGLSGQHGAISLTGGYTTTKGISAAAIGTEPDGYRQARVAGTGHFDLTDQLSVVATARYAWSHIDIDGFPAPTYTFADTPEYQVSKQASGRAGLRYRGANLDLDAGYALSDTRRSYFDPTFGSAPNYNTAGRSERADLTGRLRLPANLALDFGADTERTRFSTAFDPEQTARLTSGHALLGWYTDRATLAAGARVDDHSRFGTHTTFGANGSVRLADRLRVTASYGEGFKAPTLYQLYSAYGQLTLQPERSRSYDAGVAYGTADGTFHAGVTAFRRDSRNLIDFVSCPACRFGFGYVNVGRARAEGIEAEASLRPVDNFTVSATYTHLKATNQTPGNANLGKDLARRPRNAVTLVADWTLPISGPWSGLALGADLRLVSRSFDDAGNRTRIDGYQVATLRAKLPLGEHYELFARLENLFDATYQTVAGYGTYGRSAYAGAKLRW
jgi:vitamin B12 transporter